MKRPPKDQFVTWWTEDVDVATWALVVHAEFFRGNVIYVMGAFAIIACGASWSERCALADRLYKAKLAENYGMFVTVGSIVWEWMVGTRRTGT